MKRESVAKLAGQRWVKTSPGKGQSGAPFTIVEVLDTERRCLVRHDGSERTVSIRYDMLDGHYSIMPDAPEPKVSAPHNADDMQKMVAMAVATAMAEHERRYHSPQLKLVAEK